MRIKTAIDLGSSTVILVTEQKNTLVCKTFNAYESHEKTHKFLGAMEFNRNNIQ